MERRTGNRLASSGFIRQLGTAAAGEPAKLGGGDIGNDDSSRVRGPRDVIDHYRKAWRHTMDAAAEAKGGTVAPMTAATMMTANSKRIDGT